MSNTIQKQKPARTCTKIYADYKSFKPYLVNDFNSMIENLAYIENEAISQVKAGAEILDINVGLPEIDELEIKAKNLKKKISSLAVEIRNIRKDSARALAQKVNNHLRDLAMEYALFNIEIEELNRVRANGAENASFTLTLPDQHPQPVGKTASGAELSRILIAL